MFIGIGILWEMDPLDQTCISTVTYSPITDDDVHEFIKPIRGIS